MANNYANIEGALNAQLAADFASETLIFENQGDADGNAIEALNATHMQAWFLPGIPSTIEVGENGKERAVGIYQVTVRVPLYQGKYETLQLCGQLAVSYSKGTVLTLNGVHVKIVNSAYPSRSSRNGNYYETPVTISWLSDS